MDLGTGFVETVGSRAVRAYCVAMAGSMKDALKKSGLAPVPKDERKLEKPTSKAWREELPEVEATPHVPFDAPARTKVESPAKKTPPRG